MSKLPYSIAASREGDRGYVSRKIAAKIGASGVIYGVEIQQEMLDQYWNRATDLGASAAQEAGPFAPAACGGA